MRLLALAFIALAFSSHAARADSYEIDHEHTYVSFYVNHVGFTDMLGLFTDYEGGFTFDEKSPKNSTIDITLHPKGIHTTSAKLDEVLQGDKFFKTSAYPDIRFVSNHVAITGKNTGDITGDLTMLGVTKPLTLHVTFHKADYMPVMNVYTAGFHASATLNRSDFGMGEYIPMISDKVRIEIEIEATNTDRKKAEGLQR